MTIHIFSNDLPLPDVRRNVQQAVIKGVGDRRGDWIASIFAYTDKDGWRIDIKGPHGFTWQRDFCGPVEQDDSGAFICLEIDRCLPRW